MELPDSFFGDVWIRLTRDPGFLAFYGTLWLATFTAAVWAWTRQSHTRGVVAVPASPGEIRRFKESAWQTPAAVERYAERTTESSRAMLLEEQAVLARARGRVLDLGAGTGRFARLLTTANHQVVAVDLSPQMLRTGQQLAAVSYPAAVASAFSLPFQDDSFDTVISFWLLVHFPEWRQIVAEMIRVVRPGGTVIFEIQNRENFRRGQELNPAAPFVARMATAEGFNAFATPQDIVELASRSGARAIGVQHYDIFNDNFVAQAVLGDRYPAWEQEIAEACRSEACRQYWNAFEASLTTGDATLLARKIICVVQKDGAAVEAARPVVVSSTSAMGDGSSDGAIATSRRLFAEAFGSFVATGR